MLVVLAGWILPAWVAIEVVPSKQPGDVLVLAPGLALLVAVALASAPLPVGRLSARTGWWLLAVVAAGLVFAFNAAAVLAAGHASLPGLGLGALATIAAFAATSLLLRGRLDLGVVAVVVAAAAMATLAFAVVPEGTLGALAWWSAG